MIYAARAGRISARDTLNAATCLEVRIAASTPGLFRASSGPRSDVMMRPDCEGQIDPLEEPAGGLGGCGEGKPYYPEPSRAGHCSSDHRTLPSMKPWRSSRYRSTCLKTSRSRP